MLGFLKNFMEIEMKNLLRKSLDAQLAATEEGKPLARLRPLVEAVDHFFFEVVEETPGPPHIRDAVNTKRWMSLVVVSLIPVILWALWNTGLQKLVYTSGDRELMRDFFASSHSLSAYFDFVAKEGRWWSALLYGLGAFIPIMLVSYVVGGIVEVVFACVRRHPISEGFLVTGMLYALILPPTLPLWMAALGIATGIIISKELFGGVGRNIVNPALCCRLILFFAFPAQMTGDIWVGTNPYVVREALLKVNKDIPAVDGYTQATPLKRVNVGIDVERIHVDAIAAQFPGVQKVSTQDVLEPMWAKWAKSHDVDEELGAISQKNLRQFLITPKEAGGLGLLAEDYEGAWKLASLQYEQGVLTDWNFFLGNKLGCFGETSTLACLLGAIFLVWTGIGSWKTMAAVLLGALSTAFLFELPSLFAENQGAFSPALFAIPAYKHLLLGGLAFGAVFMATDPVSSPTLSASKWIYGILIGFLTIIIRTVNPAFPEGVMLAIILGNVAAPLIDHGVSRWYRRRHSFTALGTLGFIAALSIVAALVLSLVSGMLKERQEYAKELDRSRQLLLSARIYSPKGYLQLYRDGEYLPAHHVGEGKLLLGEKRATDADIFAVYQRHVRPILVDLGGRKTTYEKQQISMEKHLKEWKKTGSGELEYLPLFGILPESGQEPFVSYVVPVSGYGLWDRIYGYICINNDGKTVCGIAWYDHQETPGLGGEIASYDWQKQFSGKQIFQCDEEGNIDIETSPLGISVVKGKVEDVLGDSEKRKSAVDGISGATLTGNGVMRAYKDSLEPYRPFFKRLTQDGE